MCSLARTLHALVLACTISGLLACAEDAAGTTRGGVSTGDSGANEDAATRGDGARPPAPDAAHEDDDFGFEELDVLDDTVDETSPADAGVDSGLPDASVPSGFRCDEDRMEDGICDCGCGMPDPDCRDLGCPEEGCFADGCERCEGAAGEIECARGSCPAGFELDGACDCGCRERDPDCLANDACLEPGCSAPGCARCHDGDGALLECGGWLCDLERQGANDGCNCGCGVVDPDCEQGFGCEGPGCLAEGCTTCRTEDGSPMSCPL